MRSNLFKCINSTIYSRRKYFVVLSIRENQSDVGEKCLFIQNSCSLEWLRRKCDDASCVCDMKLSAILWKVLNHNRWQLSTTKTHGKVIAANEIANNIEITTDVFDLLLIKMTYCCQYRTNKQRTNNPAMLFLDSSSK